MMSSGHDALNFNEQSNILTHTDSNVLSSYRTANEYLWPCCLDCVITRSSSDKMSQCLLFRDKLINTSRPFHMLLNNILLSFPQYFLLPSALRSEALTMRNEETMGNGKSCGLLVHVDYNSIPNNHSICHYLYFLTKY